ncbi:NADH-quinone oxidoreductase subunit L [Halovenus sp. WSH3]|uniref:NADH-quinone oxidoreductase subunit L n=1 Tax=Halovenus carboxidivorans TaxID=2692199 RepID=A0A6B0TE96_9EURY|nr:NADH-quinone oxidoreductase subunit L [Halovenus carboxidivorans]MXR51519.1 NADH-quinone oxidoreductase subunit L [Halovenus carboxidivorans]
MLGTHPLASSISIPIVPGIGGAEVTALFPLVTFVLILAFGRYLPFKGAFPGIVATGLGFLVALATVVEIAGGAGPRHETLHTLVAGVSGEGVTLTFGVLIDPLSALMLTIVGLISLLVHLFSLGYMNAEGEIDLPRYYAALSLFTFSMMAFVLSDNLLMSFVFFELVGLCSYLLIGFWYREPGPASAAKKAFLVTRFGDYFFLIGVVAVLGTFGTAQFASYAPGVEASFVEIATDALEHGETGEMRTFLGLGERAWITAIGLLVLGGAVGKSAQFPLHTWLPDAMEGPTPVSALIHAATMVAAGVFLIARMYGFYALSPTALAVIALVGGFTAFFAATMALVKQELKQVLAYSTISQYGYMMLALGGGGYVAAVFHLTTHAIFKALLFLGAGAVIIAMHHEENMWEMGGLKDEMRTTYLTFLAGSLALAGIFPFAGFWSKDEVLFETLVHALGGGAPVLFVAYALGLLAVILTAFYTFRMVLLTFHGDPRTDTAEDPHSITLSMKVPLVVLGVLSVVAGVLNMGVFKGFLPENALFLERWLDGATMGEQFRESSLTAEHYHHVLTHDFGAGYSSGYAGLGEGNLALVGGVVALVLALIPAAVAWRLYGGAEPDPHMMNLGRIRTVLMNNYYQDEYQVWLARGFTLPIATLANKFDQGIIDGLVDGSGGVSLFAGGRFRQIQTGVATTYAALLVLGLLILIAVFAVTGGWI